MPKLTKSTMANHRNRSARCVTAYATSESPANGNVQANVRRTGWTAGMRKNPAIWGASAQRIAPSTRPKPTEAENAACSCRGSSVGRCTIAGPMPSSQKMVENPNTTVAAPTMPKSVGETNRAKRKRTTRRRTAYTALPPPVQTSPARVRWVRPRSPRSDSVEAAGCAVSGTAPSRCP